MLGRSTGVTVAELAALNAFNNKNTANRFRSYSVNAKEKYADGDEEDLDQYEQMMYPGQLTPSAESAAAQAAAIHEAVRQHNLEVQAFANFASANRPRARTAGVLDSPSSRVLRNYLPTPSRLDSSITQRHLWSFWTYRICSCAHSQELWLCQLRERSERNRCESSLSWQGDLPRLWTSSNWLRQGAECLKHSWSKWSISITESGSVRHQDSLR